MPEAPAPPPPPPAPPPAQQVPPAPPPALLERAQIDAAIANRDLGREAFASDEAFSWYRHLRHVKMLGQRNRAASERAKQEREASNPSPPTRRTARRR